MIPQSTGGGVLVSAKSLINKPVKPKTMMPVTESTVSVGWQGSPLPPVKSEIKRPADAIFVPNARTIVRVKAANKVLKFFIFLVSPVIPVNFEAPFRLVTLSIYQASCQSRYVI